MTSQKTAIFGGTFDTVHEGHERLFEEAKKFTRVVIGLTTDSLAKKSRNYKVKPYAKRRKTLMRHLRRFHLHANIIPLPNRFGIGTSMKDIHSIIVSEETEPVAKEINAIRRRKKLPLLKIICVPLKFALDYKKLSAEYIYFRKTDRSGHRLSKLSISLGSKNPSKINGTKKALLRIFGKNLFSLRAFSPSSGIPSQPFGRKTISGAINRAKNSYKKAKNADFGIGLESGLFSLAGRHCDILFCAVYDGQHITIGNSMGFEVPHGIVEEIKVEKSELGHVVSRMAGVKGIGKKGGAIHYLSGGLLSREQMIEQAVLCAFIPRIHRALH